MTDSAEVARALHEGFREYLQRFNAVTGRSRSRFERCQWQDHQADALERLSLYRDAVRRIVGELTAATEQRRADRKLWSKIKQRFAERLQDEPNPELARTFYNSITRRIFSTVGVNPDTEFTVLDPQPEAPPSAGKIFNRYEGAAGAPAVFREILEDYRFAVDYRDVEADIRGLADRLDAVTSRFESIELLRPVFFRNKAAYLLGRVICRDCTLPLALALLNSDEGIFVDAVLLRESAVSILFSFTRSYFHVEAERPREVIDFLQAIIPLKPIEDLYSALGLNKHGKTELYRSLRRHLERSVDRFEVATGDRGMVMLVFTLPSYDRVFKVIRDNFAFPKNTTAREVMERYRLVFERDRVGRLVEAQQFRDLKFRVDRFSEDLLEELMQEAGHTVRRDGDHLVIGHLYTERKVTPLNLYLREVDIDTARAAVVDYGHAIKELAAANIFPGDFLLKNFGVTRHGRVVFYDYDELCLLTDCRFRELPAPRNPEDELAAEPWFTVGEHDVFPEEFARFLGLPDGLHETFQRYHGDLFTARFWSDLQRMHEGGAILNFFPYPPEDRLRMGGG